MATSLLQNENSIHDRLIGTPTGRVSAPSFDLSLKRSWCSPTTGNPEGIPALEGEHIKLSNPELRGVRPMCFNRNQWHDWVTSSVENYMGEEQHDGYCYACLPEYKAEQIAVGRCWHQQVGFEEEDGGIVGRRMIWLQRA